MKKLYYFLFALLATATLTAQTPATHEVAVLAEDEISGQCGENLYWHYADGTLTITGSGEMFNYTTSITGVAPWNKFRNTITQVVLPKGLTTVGSYAFDNCKALSTLTIPDSVTMIGNYAFRNCSTAYAIILGERLTNINNYAFYGCRKLTNIFIKAQAQPVLGGSGSLSSIPTYATIYVPCGQANAYQNAQYWSKFAIREMPTYAICTTTDNTSMGHVETSIECESNVATIMAQPNVGYIFTNWDDGNTENPRNIALTKDTFFTAYFTKAYSGTCGDNLTWAYNNGTLTITGSGDPYPYRSNTMPWYLLRDSITTILLPEGLTSISSYMFCYCRAVQNIVIPNNVKNIEGYAFNNCQALSYVIIGEKVENIGDWAFYNCSALTNIIIPDSVKVIGERAFRGTYLRSLTIGKNVETIGNYAFGEISSGCSTSLTSVIVNAIVPPILQDYSLCLPSTTPVLVGCGLKETYQHAPYWDNLTVLEPAPYQIVFSSDTKSGYATIISSQCSDNQVIITATPNTGYSFTQWSDGNTDNPRHIILTQDTIFTAIFEMARSGQCGDNLYWQYANGVLNITGEGVMDNYSSSSLTPWHLFQDSILTIQLPTKLSSIGKYAFGGCHAFCSIVIPDSVNYIQNTAFSGCSSLSSITWNARACSSNSNNTSPFGNGVTPNITKFIFGDNVESIPAALCYNMQKLETIVIPSSIAYIPANTFSNCRNLVSITVKRVLPPVIYNNNVFNNVPTYALIHVPCGQTEAYQSADYWNRFSNFYEGYVDIDAKSTNPAAGYVTISATCDFNMATLTATANTGYIFTQWNDGVTDNPRAITLTQDTSFTASFEVGLSGKCGDNLYYSYYEGILRISGSGDMYDYTSNNTNPAPWYLVKDSITMISISPNATSIGAYAFQRCDSIVDIIIPNKVTRIGHYAFNLCKNLSSVIIGQSVSSIEDFAFSGCQKLNYIIIPKSVTYIGRNTFFNTQWWNNQADGQIYINDILCGYKGTLKNDTTIVVRDGTRSISPGALTNSRIVSLVIPNSVTTIGRNLPYSLISLTMQAEEPPTIDTLTFSKNDYAMATVYVPCGAVPKYASAKYWSNFSNIREQIPYSVTINTNNKNYGYSVISQTECGSNEVSIKAIVKSDKYQFVQWNDGNTDNPRTITLTQDTTFTATFDNVYAYSGTCGDNLVWDYDPLRKSLTITGNGEMYDYAKASETPWYSIRQSITAVNLPSGLTRIGSYAFSGCSFITPSITIPDSVVSIGTSAFSGCSGISSFNTGDSIVYIGQNAFNSTGWYYNQPNGAVYVGNVLYIYKNYVSFGTVVDIKEGTISISPYAFSNKYNSFSITIPSSVVNIGNNAFKDCKYLTSITSYAEVPPVCGANVFYNVPTSIPVYVPETAIEAYKATEPWSKFTNIRVICVPKQYDIQVMACDVDYYDWNGVAYTENGTYLQTFMDINGCDSTVALTLTFKQNDYSYTIDDVTETATVTGLRNDTVTHVVIPEAIGCDVLYPVVAIADNAFAGNTAITSVSAENNVETIGAGAFRGCTALGNLVLGSSMQNIGENAFHGCRQLIYIYCKPTIPPYAEPSSFYNYNVYLNVPCSSVDAYQTDMVFGSFKYIRCNDKPTEADQIITDNAPHTAQKVLRDGTLYIIRNGIAYTLSGTEVK